MAAPRCRVCGHLGAAHALFVGACAASTATGPCPCTQCRYPVEEET